MYGVLSERLGSCSPCEYFGRSEMKTPCNLIFSCGEAKRRNADLRIAHEQRFMNAVNRFYRGGRHHRGERLLYVPWRSIFYAGQWMK